MNNRPQSIIREIETFLLEYGGSPLHEIQRRLHFKFGLDWNFSFVIAKLYKEGKTGVMKLELNHRYLQGKPVK